MEPVRFSAVVPDLIARAPEVFCRKLCVYLVCVTGAEEMAGIMGFIYVHTHLHCPVSGTLTRGTHSCRETSLVPLYIETAFMSRRVIQRDYSNKTTRSCKNPWLRVKVKSSNICWRNQPGFVCTQSTNTFSVTSSVA